ncbi:helix-turn-helix domain-containing protein [Serratia marcescens]|uniref:helix-turn-helix domain-containing protein n=1 Tax=Serratia marcescens TaxID=615 RepID=UPI003D15F330
MLSCSGSAGCYGPASLASKFGRKRSVDRYTMLALYQKGIGATEIARQLSNARSTFYKTLEEGKSE